MIHGWPVAFKEFFRKIKRLDCAILKSIHDIDKVLRHLIFDFIFEHSEVGDKYLPSLR